MKLRHLLHLAAMVLLLMAFSCTMEQACPDKAPVADGSEGVIHLNFKYSGSPETKSVLGSTANDTSIEGKLTDICWAFYNSRGEIERSGYSSNPSKLTERIRKGEKYTLFLLANMGDLSKEFPRDTSSVNEMEYLITEFDGVKDKGIPMSGRAEGVLLSSSEGTITVLLERLFAKIKLRIDKSIIAGANGLEGEYSVGGLKSGCVFLRNCNACLKPFGDSRASGPEDILQTADRMEDMNDIEDLMAESGMSQERIEELWGAGPAYAVDTTIVFYVPENLQGNLLSGSDSWGKTADAIGAETAAKCTYLEYTLGITPGAVGGFGGTVSYRFFLGEDATKNFDVRRNSVYNVHLSITAEGTLKDNWKVERRDDFTMGLQLDWAEEQGSWKTGKAPEYLGQGGVLTVEGTANPTSVTVEPSGLARVTANEDGSYDVYAIGSGKVTVTVYDSSDDRIKGQAVFEVNIPEASIPSSVSLNPDGTVVDFIPSYLKSDKTALNLSTLHPYAYDDFYRPSLVNGEGKYSSFLKLDSNKKQICFRRSSDAMTSAAGSNAHRVSFGTKQILKEGTFAVNYVDPFGKINVQGLSDIENCSLLANTDIPASSLEKIEAYKKWRDLSMSISYDTAINCSSDTLIRYETRPDGNEWNPSSTDAFRFTDIKRASCRMISNTVDISPAIGRHSVVAKVHNKHTPEDYVSREVAYFDSYVHVCVGANRYYGDIFMGSDPAGVGEYNNSDYSYSHLYAGKSNEFSFNYDDYFGVLGFVELRFLHDVNSSSEKSPLLNILGNCPSNGDLYGCSNIVKCSESLTLTDTSSPIYDNAYRNGGKYADMSVRLYDPGNTGNTHSERFEGIGDLLYRVTRFTTKTSADSVTGNWQTLLELDDSHAPKVNYYSYTGNSYTRQENFPYRYYWKDGPSKGYVYIYRLQDIVPSTNGWIDLL